MTKTYYNLTLSAFLTAITLVFLVALAGAASAAGVKVCYKDVAPDVTDINLYVGSTKTTSVFAGQSQADGSVCATISPLPAPILRGTTQTYTLRAVNTIGEEGPASNALSFRYPSVPSAPSLVSVGAVVP